MSPASDPNVPEAKGIKPIPNTETNIVLRLSFAILKWFRYSC